MSSIAILMLALTYASVSLYKMFCKATGFDGIIRKTGDDETIAANVRKLSQRIDKSHRHHHHFYLGHLNQNNTIFIFNLVKQL